MAYNLYYKLTFDWMKQDANNKRTTTCPAKIFTSSSTKHNMISGAALYFIPLLCSAFSVVVSGALGTFDTCTTGRRPVA